MPLTKAQNNVTWDSGASTSKTVVAGGTATSDAVIFPDNDTWVAVVIDARNPAATPAADAKLEVYVLPSLGDVDGDAVDDFTTPGHASLIASMDVSSGGETPARREVTLDTGWKAVKFYVKNTGATDSIDVRIRYGFQQAS